MADNNKNQLIKVKTIDEDWIKEHIYTIRNQKIMLDSDLADIYGYELKAMNQQVKRNIERFPEDFMFQLTKDEVELVKSQIVTSRENTFFSGQGGGRRKIPYAFTEQGIYMLATVLRGEIAVKQHTALVRLFKMMKDYIVETNQTGALLEYSKTQSIETAHRRMNLLEERIQKVKSQMSEKADIKDIMEMMEPFNEYRKEEYIILDKGKPLQAAAAYNEIYKSATRTIDIVDDYIGLRTLSLLVGINKDVIVKIYSHNMSEITEEAFNSFVKECPCKIRIYRISAKEIHDRLIVIDSKKPSSKGYMSGCSSKNSGESLSAIIKSDAARDLLKKVAENHKDDKPIYSNR